MPSIYTRSCEMPRPEPRTSGTGSRAGLDQVCCRRDRRRDRRRAAAEQVVAGAAEEAVVPVATDQKVVAAEAVDDLDLTDWKVRMHSFHHGKYERDPDS